MGGRERKGVVMGTPKGLNMPYFAIDMENRVFVTEDGDQLSLNQFKKILGNADGPIDMTLMCQRFVQYDFNWDRLERYYDEA